MNAPQTAVARRDNTFSSFMLGETVRRKVNEIVGSKKGDGFVTSIVANVSNNPALADCDHATILSAGMQGAALDLSCSPVLGHFYMVPFKDNKNNRTVAQFQIGYKGYIQLAIRSGQYRRINVISLKEGEMVSYNRLTEEIYTKLIDDDEQRERMPSVGYYAMFELMNGFIKTMYWSAQKMEAHAIRYSKGYQAKKGYTFWEKDFDGMAFKTMLRQLLSKWGVMSVEMQQAFTADMGVIDQNGNVDYIDNDAEIIGASAQDKQPETPVFMSQEDFDRGLPGWTKTIEDGKKTADQVIAFIESKDKLTDEHKAILQAIKPKEKEAPQDGNDQVAADATINAMLKKATEAAISHADITKHLGVKSLAKITNAQVEKALAFINNPAGE